MPFIATCVDAIGTVFWDRPGSSNFFLGGGVSNFLGGLQLFGGFSNFLGVSNISRDLQFCGGLQFLGGDVWLRGALRGVKGTPNFFSFLGGEFFFDFCFLWGSPPTRHQNMVNVQLVRILLECILVILDFSKISQIV